MNHFIIPSDDGEKVFENFLSFSFLFSFFFSLFFLSHHKRNR